MTSNDLHGQCDKPLTDVTVIVRVCARLCVCMRARAATPLLCQHQSIQSNIVKP